jgi:hypothetical protein
MNFSKQSYLGLGILFCIAIGITATVSRGKNAIEPQDPASLDRRISMLEQRLYSIESNISRLQQYATTQRPSQVTSPGASDRDITLLQEEIQRLTLRLGEVECGVLKLDERTTTPRKKSADPCRQNPDAPLRLATRP